MIRTFKIIKHKVTDREVLIKALLIVLTTISVFYAKESEREILNVVGFAAAFLVSIYLHKHFFPLVTMTSLFYLLASSQELYTQGVEKLPIIDTYWSIGNALLIITILSFAYNLIFKYQIVKYDDSKSK